LNEFGASSKQPKSQVLSIPKLEDANLAGRRQGVECTLILTEGDSAKALAVAGLEIAGRDKFGVFPLRGKLMNVRDVSAQRLANNAELRSLCAILGLQYKKTYETWEERKELRYGHVMLMTDQDADGSHIKGLFMNFLRCHWPALLRPPIGKSELDVIDNRPFLSMFVTPLLKATKKGKKGHETFFSLAAYNKWRESLDDDEVRKWSIKYYKGLGTSTSAEAKEYFDAFGKHHRPFRWQSEKEDGWRIDMAFAKGRADDRKDWILKKYDVRSTLLIDENDGNSVTFGDFVDNELIHFSNSSNIRALPNVIDGLKPSQRKVLFACFKRNLKDEVKVAQLAGYCAEHTAYHHGEASLHSTIIGMAQDFVGSNNINLLIPSGQFGTRLMGGSDAASPRYIFTYLSPLARLLFPDVDDMVCTILIVKLRWDKRTSYIVRLQTASNLQRGGRPTDRTRILLPCHPTFIDQWL
jgi:DNA topoisomerase-2